MYKGKYAAAPGTPAAKRRPRKKNGKKQISVGSIIFWLFYLLLIAACVVGIRYGLNFLEGWLTDFELSQPDYKCQEVYSQLFEGKDWGSLYTLAGMEDSQFETKENYVAYMQNKAKDKSLSYYETSAGLSGDRKYIVKLGDEKIAVFTLTRDEPEGITQIVPWELGGVEIFMERLEDVRICTAGENRQVYINGNLIRETYVVRTLSTAAEDYLPEDLSGLTKQWMYVDGLLTHPVVTVTDQHGMPIDMIYDEATNTYVEPAVEMVISQEEMDSVVNAAKAYCRFMIGANTDTTLRRYFDETTSIYKTILKNDRSWMQNYNSYNFSQPQISSFYRYSDTLYSVRLTMTLNVVRGNGSIREYPLDSTFFLEKQGSKWLVVEMTNVEVQEQTEKVRLDFVVNGEVVSTMWHDISQLQLQPPKVDTPDGKRFTGWYRETVDESGNKTMSLVFNPDETGIVYLSTEAQLDYMVLHALFENAEG